MNVTLPQIRKYDADEFILGATAADGRPRLRVYRPVETTVVLGRGSDPQKELRLNFCHTDRVPIMRRRGGGCSVVVDPGNVIVSVVLPIPGINHTHRHFNLLTAWLIDSLARLGLAGIYPDGISDFVADGHKVGGSCVYRTKGLLYYSTTLLIDPDFSLIDRYLTHPPREPEYRDGRGHRDFLGLLADDGTFRNPASFAAALERHLSLDNLPWRSLTTAEPT